MSEAGPRLPRAPCPACRSRDIFRRYPPPRYRRGPPLPETRAFRLVWPGRIRRRPKTRGLGKAGSRWDPCHVPSLQRTHPVSLTDKPRPVGDVHRHVLSESPIEDTIRVRQTLTIPLCDLDLALQVQQRRQLARRVDEGRRDIDAADLAAKPGREVTRRTAQAAADVEDMVVRSDGRTVRQFDRRRKTARMVVIERRPPSEAPRRRMRPGAAPSISRVRQEQFLGVIGRQLDYHGGISIQAAAAVPALASRRDLVGQIGYQILVARASAERKLLPLLYDQTLQYAQQRLGGVNVST